MARHGPRPVRHLRLLPAAGRLAAADGRCLRQRLRAGRRPRGHRRLRLRRAQPGDARGRRGHRGGPLRALRHRRLRRPRPTSRPAPAVRLALGGAPRHWSWPCRRMSPGPAARAMAATQVQVHIRSTRSPSSSRTTRATAQSADPGEHHPGGVHLQRGRGLLRRSGHGATLGRPARSVAHARRRTIMWHAVAARHRPRPGHASPLGRPAAVSGESACPTSPVRPGAPRHRRDRRRQRHAGRRRRRPARAAPQRRPAGAAEERAGPLLRDQRPALDGDAASSAAG